MTYSLPNDLQIRPLQFITETPEPILWATSAPGLDVCYAVWHVPTSASNETIFISRILNDNSEPQNICEGADPDCLLTESGWYISWVKKDPTSGVWTIYLSAFDESNMRVSSTIPVATEVQQLVTRPFLARYDREPCLVYLNLDSKKRTVIHTYFINSRLTLHGELPLASAEDMIVKWSANRLVAIIETAKELTVLTFDGGEWKIITGITKKNSPPCRFDFAVRDDTVMIIMSHLESRVATLSVDLPSGRYGKKWSICHYGKFPSIVPAGDWHWLISWAGAPPLSEGEQGKDDTDNSVGYAMVRSAIINEVNAPESTTKLDRVMTEMEELWGQTSVGPWAPLWLGLINNEGKCLKSYGPLGSSADDVWSTQLSIKGRRAVLLWRTNGDMGETENCLLKAREIILPED